MRLRSVDVAMDDLLAEFLEETSGRMARLDMGLAALADAPTDSSLLQEVHTLLRTIKGTSGFLKLPELESLAQAADAVVDQLRTGDIELSADVSALIGSAMERIKSVLAHLNATATEPGYNHDRLIDDLSYLAETGDLPAGQPDNPKLIQDAAIEREEPVFADSRLVRTEPVTDADTVHVKTDLLQNLMKMVSELGSTRNQLMDILRRRGDREVDASLQRLADVTADLRQGVLQTQQGSIKTAVVVRCADQRFAVLQESIAEAIFTGPASDFKIEDLHGSAVLPLGEEILPLVHLASVFELPVDDQAAENQNGLVLVIQDDEHRFGMVVDEAFETEEILVQPVASLVRSIPYYGGSAVLSDGMMSMVLEPAAFAPHADTKSHGETRSIQSSPSAYLLFQAGNERPMAVAFSQISRLEEVDFNDVDIGETGMSLAYRDRMLPLIHINNTAALPATGRKPVLVITAKDRMIGLVVDDVLDFVDTRIALQPSTKRPGILGSAIISGTLTEILDCDFYLHRIASNGTVTDLPIRADRVTRRHVLLVAESTYIRNLLAPILAMSGFEVVTAATAEQAQTLCEANPKINVVVCDIDLVDRSGFALVETLRNDARWSDLPIIAVSSRGTEKDLRECHAIGFSDYIDKYNRDGLLQALADLS